MIHRAHVLLLLIITALTIHTFADSPSLNAEDTADKVLISEDGKPVLHYQKTPLSFQGQFERANYIHPLHNLDGVVITEDFPDDHLHQRGIFWTWHQIMQGDKRLGDGWECRDIAWEVLSAETALSPAGCMILKTKVHWKSPNLSGRNGDMTPFVEERAVITVYPAQAESRKIDFEIRLLALEQEIFIGGSEDAKGYGGFSPRILLPEDVDFRGINGPITPETNAVPAGAAVDITGTFSGSRKSGVAIIQHPSNPGFPQGWILRSKNSMQNPVYPGQQPVKLSSSEPLVLRYRLILHGPGGQDLEALVSDYSSLK